MPKLPAISAKATIKALEHFGFKIYRQTGSQIRHWNDSASDSVIFDCQQGTRAYAHGPRERAAELAEMQQIGLCRTRICGITAL